MPSNSANGKDEKQYEALKGKGTGKERAAKIGNSPGAAKGGGKQSGGGGNPAGRDHRPAQNGGAQERERARQVSLTAVSTAGPPSPTEQPLIEVRSVEELVELVERSRVPLYVRFSSGLDDDRSVDHESGLPLPGLAVNPLHPPDWWKGPPVSEWVTRQVQAYQHLRQTNDDRRCWVLTGSVVDRGPDNEPLLTDAKAVGVLSNALVDACAPAGAASSRQEDAPEEDGSAPWQS